MHSALSRLNAIGSYTAVVLFVAVVINSASHIVMKADPSVSITAPKLFKAYVPDLDPHSTLRLIKWEGILNCAAESLPDSKLHSNSHNKAVLANLGDLKPNQVALLVQMDVEADFTPVWTWNTKQVFVYIMANYETKDKKKHEVAVWDKVITSKSDLRLSSQQLASEYFIIDQESALSNIKVTLSVHWNTVPVAGLLFDGVSGSSSFSVPSKIDLLEEEKSTIRYYG